MVADIGLQIGPVFEGEEGAFELHIQMGEFGRHLVQNISTCAFFWILGILMKMQGNQCCPGMYLLSKRVPLLNHSVARRAVFSVFKLVEQILVLGLQDIKHRIWTIHLLKIRYGGRHSHSSMEKENIVRCKRRHPCSMRQLYRFYGAGASLVAAFCHDRNQEV